MTKKLEEFISVEKVDLKWIFDHFRNYGIAGFLMYAAKHVAISPNISPIPYFNWFATIAFFIISIALFTLNFLHSIEALKVFNKNLPSKWIFIIFFLFWFLLMQQLLGIRLSA
jgi:hypothetical protein